MKKNNQIYYYLGNLLLLLSILGFIFIFYPLVQIYLYPPKIQLSLPRTGTYITIPKISAQAPIKENIDPFNPAEYHEALKTSVAHAKGTSLPGQHGTMFLFAHSSGAPWEITRFNTIFLRLAELNKGDTIDVQKDGHVYKYIVSGKKEVFSREVNYLLQVEKNQLVLQTCTPIGTDWKRLLIFAKPT